MGKEAIPLAVHPAMHPFLPMNAHHPTTLGSELLISRNFDEPEGHVARALLPARLCGIIGGQECPPHKKSVVCREAVSLQFRVFRLHPLFSSIDQAFWGLILNVAIGGAWGGQKGIDQSIFPQRMLIDYVRVYRRKDRECWGHPRRGNTTRRRERVQEFDS